MSETSLPATRTRRTGSQRPTRRVCPPWHHTYGDAANDLANAYASPLMPWQRDVLDDWLSRDEQGRPIAITIGLDVPRQNGKNYCIEIFELTVAVVLGWHVLHTAHEVKTSMKAFNRVCSYFDGPDARPELKEMVKRIRRTNGQESIELTNGGVIEFSARSRQAARGFDDIQVVVFDEAQELTDEQVNAILPTLAASSTGTRQIIYTGTPTPPNSPGTVMQQLREQALNGELRACCWWSWSVEEPPKATATFEDVLDLIYQTNPSMGVTLDEDFTASEFATQTKDGFARERLNWWLRLSQTSLISKDDWRSCAADPATLSQDERYRDPELCKVTYGIKFAVDGSLATLAVCIKPNDDTLPPLVDLIDVRPGREGVNWLADWLEARRDVGSCVVIDGAYGSGALTNELVRNKRFPKRGIVNPSPGNVATAASMLKQRIDTHKVAHLVGQERLDLSALRAERRDIGKSGAWGFSGEDPTPIEACSLALFGALTTKRNAGRRLRVG